MRLPGLKVFWIPLVTSFIGMRIPDFIERWFVAPLPLLTYQNDSTALQVVPGTTEDCFLGLHSCLVPYKSKDFSEEHSQGPYEVALYGQGLAPLYEALRLVALFLVYGLTCLQGYDIVQPRHLHIVTRCEEGEDCPDNSTSNGDACSECCSSDLCNANSCGEPGYPLSRGPACYNCQLHNNEHPCTTIDICSISEECSIVAKDEFGDQILASGCTLKHACRNSGANPVTIVGKRSEEYQRSSSRILCEECCSSDLCNLNCSIDHCYASPCHHGTCSSDGASYSCSCTEGWTGRHCDHYKPNENLVELIDGARWRAFWWYKKGSGWPRGLYDVLHADYGSCARDAPYCFGRLPQGLNETGAEMLGKDSAGNIYRWSFDARNPTAHAVWKAFHDHIETPAGNIVNNQKWNPKTVAGNTTTVVQDSFMYRMEHGIASLLLDDDNCDCATTLNLGHGMCGAGYSTSYGPEKLGVDLLYDPGCQTPSPDSGLTLYFRDEDDCAGMQCAAGLQCVDGINAYRCVN